MLKSISFKKLAVLSAGIAIVLSSCGLQNSASESSGTETAAGKTKNFTLVNGQACFETESQFGNEYNAAVNLWNGNYYNWFGNSYPQGLTILTVNVGPARYQVPTDWVRDDTGFASAYWAPFASPIFGGCEEQIALLGEDVVAGIPNVATGSISVKACVKPEVKQSIIDGYTEQLARPVGGEVTEAYLAAMQKGLDVSNAMCTN
jgi:hypothetical protein